MALYELVNSMMESDDCLTTNEKAVCGDKISKQKQRCVMMWHTFVVFLHFERDVQNAIKWKKKSFHPQNRKGMGRSARIHNI